MLIYKKPIITFYKDSDVKYNIDTKKNKEALKKYNNKKISRNKFLQSYNIFIDKIDRFSKIIKKKQPDARGIKKKLLNYGNELKEIIEKSFSTSGSGLKILNTQQMFNRLPILLAQIQAGNNFKSLKNELRQMIYSLYRSNVLTKTVYNNLIKVI